MLTVILEQTTRTTERMERLEAQVAVLATPVEAKTDRLGKFLNGKFSGTLGLVSNLNGAAWVLGGVTVLINLLLAVPWFSKNTIDTLLVPVAATAVMMVTVLLGAKIRKLTLRRKFLLGILGIYTTTILVYLLKLSLTLLQHNDLPSGFLLACAVGSIYSIVSRIVVDGRELWDIARLPENSDSNAPAVP